MTCETLHSDCRPPPPSRPSDKWAKVGETLTEKFLLDLTEDLCRYFRRHGAANDAEDLAQDTLVLFFKNIDKFDETRPLRPYLFGIARHVLYDHSEEVKNHPEADLLEDIEHRPAGSPRHERLSLNEAEVRAVLKWIEENISLSDFQRRTVALRTKGFTPQEIAYLLNDTARRVSRELQRARKKIQARLHRRDFADRGSDEEA